jgi:3-oxoacyl-[acyl-carrier protein] reductase
MMGPPYVLLLSGGSRGLGQAICEDFLARGAAVATFSRSPTPFTERAQCEPETRDRFFWQVLDATAGAAQSAFVLAARKRFGRIDGLVNNVAVATSGLLALARPGEIHGTLALNLEAALLLTQRCCRVMLHQGSGAILNVSSVNALRGHAGVAVYSATKAALDGLTRSLAREVGPKGIRVNSLAPGYFESEMVAGLTAEQKASIARRTPLGRLANTADLVAAARFLLSADAAFITGQTLVVDGGLTC